jgi:hypothetical protein
VQVIPQEQVDIQTSILAELQKRVVKAEVTVAQKEEENAALKDQLQQNEKRWLDYEAKMKAMEEMWQVQMASLQVSFHVNSISVTKCMHHMLYCGMYNRSLKNSLRTVEKLIISYGFYIELSLCFTRYGLGSVRLSIETGLNMSVSILGMLAVHDDLLNKQGTANDH